MTHKKERSITFGKVMLTLLVVGVFIVIGLLITLYLTVISTPERTAAATQLIEASAPCVNYIPPNSSALTASEAQNIKTTPMSASTTPSTSSAAFESTTINEEELHTPAILTNSPSPSKKSSKKSNEQKTQTETPLIPKESTMSERELTPTNVTPKPKPTETNNKGEKELKPINVTPREQPKSTPRSEKAPINHNDATHDLF